MTGRAAAQGPPPVVDPWAESPPAEPEPAEPKREDPKPAKTTDPTVIRPSLHMRWLRWRNLPPARPNYRAEPFTGDPEPSALDIHPYDPFPSPEPYPRSFVQRPLVLPEGLREKSLGMRVDRESSTRDRTDLQGYATGVIGADGFDIFGAVTLNLASDEVEELDLPLFHSAVVGIDIAVASNTALGLQGAMDNRDDRRKRYAPSLFITHKVGGAARSALYLNGNIDYSYQNDYDANADDEFETQRFGATATATGRTQATPLFAMQVSLAIGYFKYVDDYHPQDDSYRALSAALALLFSIADNADLVTYVSLATANDGGEELGTAVAGMSLAWR